MTEITPDMEAAADRGVLRRRLGLIAIGVLAVALVASLVTGSVLTLSNRDRAERWQERAVVLEEQKRGLNLLLVERTRALNARTSQLNRMAATVRRARTSLRRSEQDVAAFARRQRELANEKAQVEDEREQLAVQKDALTSVASAYVDCKDGLVELLGYVLDENFIAASTIIRGVVEDCGAAESGLDSYLSTYGG